MNPYTEILERADEHFRRVAQEQPDALTCRIGCTLCCHGLFEISAADVVVLSEGLRMMDPEQRHALVQRAAEVMDRLHHPRLEEVTREEKETFFDEIAGDEPCPALSSSGACTIYEHRPLVCRTFGLPIREGAEYRGEECELNFTGSSQADLESAAWDLEWEDAFGGDQLYTVPQAIVLAGRLLAAEGQSSSD